QNDDALELHNRVCKRRIGGLQFPVKKLRDLAEGFQILKDLLADGGALNLDRHQSSIPQSSPVDLAERGRGDRRRFEFQKGLRDPRAKITADDLFDLAEGEWLDRILKPRERIQMAGRQEVRPGGKKLSDLHESGAE